MGVTNHLLLGMILQLWINMFYDKYLRPWRDLFDPCGVLKDIKPIGGLHSVCTNMPWIYQVLHVPTRHDEMFPKVFAQPTFTLWITLRPLFMALAQSSCITKGSNWSIKFTDVRMRQSSMLLIISSCSTQSWSRKPQQTGQPVQNQTTYRYPRGKLDLTRTQLSPSRFQPFC